MGYWVDEASPDKEDVNLVQEESAPLLFSQKAISTFSFLVNPLLGAILLSINLKILERAIKSVPVILFALIYDIVFIYLFSLASNSRTDPGMIFVPYFSVGGLIMNFYFWPKYIGKETQYRARSIRNPLIISIGLYLLFFISLFPSSIDNKPSVSYLTFGEPEGKLVYNTSNIGANDVRYMRDRLNEMSAIGPNRVSLVFIRKSQGMFELVIPVQSDGWKQQEIVGRAKSIYEYLNGFAPRGPIIVHLTYPDTNVIRLTIDKEIIRTNNY
jgi:hypothetical protein